MKRVAIIGIGHSKFGIRKDVSLRELAFESVKECLTDAGITTQDVDSMVTSIASEQFAFAAQPAAQVHDYVGFNPKSAFRVEGVCASGSLAIRAGWMTVASGLADIVLVVGAEKMTEVTTSAATEIMGLAGDTQWEYPFWNSFPGYYAMFARAHMSQYGTTETQLAMVGVKNHHYGALNPLAQLGKEITLEQAMSSFTVASPLKLYDCCTIADGAAAILLASEDRAKEIGKNPVWIAGLGLGTDTASISRRSSLTSLAGVVYAARQAYEMAGVGPDDIDVAEVHDCFTIAEIIAYEDLGFCQRGEGGRFIEEKQSYRGGKVPVNIDGGLKAKGHPVGATGVSMAVEITKQLRGECGERQIAGAGIGLTHNVGGNGQVCAVHIYRSE